MNKKDFLEKQISEYEKKIENNKLKRIVLCISIIEIIIFITILNVQEITTIIDVVIVLILSVFAAGLYFYVNMFIYLPLFTKANEENIILGKMKKEYLELEETAEDKNV